MSQEQASESVPKNEAETKAEAETKGPEPEDTESLKKALASASARAESNLANWQRARADYLNYKRRSEQEREELVQYANATLIASILPILDDFERAFSAIPPTLADITWVDGLRLTVRKMEAILQTLGLCQIEAVGQPFDPNLHEAVAQVKGKEGTVIMEIQKGYKYLDKVIRPSKVAVGNGEE